MDLNPYKLFKNRMVSIILGHNYYQQSFTWFKKKIIILGPKKVRGSSRAVKTTSCKNVS